MKKITACLLVVALFALPVVFAACGGGGSKVINSTYTVTYNANNATGGSVPIDSNNYAQGQTVTVLGNTGNLVKTGYSFTDWNTLANGTGTAYTQGQTFTMDGVNVTLYAQWTASVVTGYAYVTNQMSQNISQYTIGANGALTPMSPATVAAGSEPISIAIAPSANYVYAGNNQDGTVSQYTIGTNGALTPMSPATVTTGTGTPWPSSVAVDPTGTYAYVVNEQAPSYGNVISFTIGTNGTLSSLSGPYPVGNDMLWSIAVHPSGKYAYVTSVRNDYIVYQYTIGANGRSSR